jgi:hypothetical protein
MTQTNMMRWFSSDIDESMSENLAYFQRVQKEMNNQDIQKAFYQTMIERFNSDKVKSWNEDIIPETKAKTLKIIEALPAFYKYIKEHYILKHLGINSRTDEFIETYYTITKDRTSKQQIGKYLTVIEIKPIKLSNNAGYKYVKTHQELLDIFKAKSWMDDNVDLINIDQGDKQVKELNMINKSNSQKQQEDFKKIVVERNNLQKQLDKINRHKKFINMLLSINFKQKQQKKPLAKRNFPFQDKTKQLKVKEVEVFDEGGLDDFCETLLNF